MCPDTPPGPPVSLREPLEPQMDVFRTPRLAYLGILHRLCDDYDTRSAPRGLPVYELIDYQFRVTTPYSGPLRTGDLDRDAQMKTYMRAEDALYRDGTRDAERWATEASTFWREIQNPDGTINSNYGELLRRKTCAGIWGSNETVSPWDWAKTSLMRDKDTRQAFARISLPEHQWVGNKDQPCTMHLHFRRIYDNEQRQDVLCLSAVMRSNDVWRGLSYDMPYFISLQERMLYELRCDQPDDWRQVGMGWYGHMAHSMHLYGKDRLKASTLLLNTMKLEPR
jgi:thymidylate synthase